MTLLPIAAAAMALNSMLVLGMAAFVTERDEDQSGRGNGGALATAEAVGGL
ncbi:hypothetical protein [Methylobacterium brachythecii]|uniref:Uncharacterized protein n=1 Tax=Methylobacterium brachythecii TaxID=1176177 RepID=A0A7W6AJY1_9HYPH|nr:hypothetical protein [Methylobacterium brachythecii]MBB3904793.1 hypothetical protein [Methylobacterium brachythecii]GLS45346.1 hypothetical protein GCM10007884_33360 [Methylobacterium brachythecii]